MGPKFSKSSTDSEEDLNQYYGKSVFGALPIHFIQDSLDDDLLLFLQSDPFFLTPEDKLESIGYSKAIDYPELTNHFYYEGYFHSRPCPAPFHSMNARYNTALHMHAYNGINLNLFCCSVCHFMSCYVMLRDTK